MNPYNFTVYRSRDGIPAEAAAVRTAEEAQQTAALLTRWTRQVYDWQPLTIYCLDCHNTGSHDHPEVQYCWCMCGRQLQADDLAEALAERDRQEKTAAAIIALYHQEAVK